MNKSFLKILFVILLVFDLCFSFVQHYHKSLDGDMATIVLGYPEVMNDPFGSSAILEHKIYGGTNRFFAHWTMSQYFKNVPLFLQHFATQIESVYLSCALAKTLIQLFIILGLSALISNSRLLLSYDFLLSAILITPLFQTNGYNGYMGIINSSITYTFFYSFWMAMLLLFLILFNKTISGDKGKQLSGVNIVFLICLAIVLALGGPLDAALMIIGIFVITCKELYRREIKLSHQLKNIPRKFWVLCISIGLVSLYSVYLGRYNAENFFHTVSIQERYSLLPKGLFNLFTQKLGLPILIICIILNLILLKKTDPQNHKIGVNTKWMLLFVIIYILILPLGGYREYRPNILRSDTFLPVTLCILYLFGSSTLYLLKQLSGKHTWMYSSLIIVFLGIFTLADKSVSNESECEKNALKKISASEEKIILIGSECTVLSWNKITDYHDSKINCDLLKRWDIIRSEKYYFQN